LLDPKQAQKRSKEKEATLLCCEKETSTTILFIYGATKAALGKK
jgi:hypothetical protein